jgi:hypothetical protein
MMAMLRKAGGVKAASRKLAEKEQSEDETDLPARRPSTLRLRSSDESQTPFVISAIPVVDGHAPQRRGGLGGMGGGMGMGGMGGMGGGMGGGFRVQQPPEPGGDADLLGGLRSANTSNQRSKAQSLKQRQDAGQIGGGGGMGGGFF